MLSNMMPKTNDISYVSKSAIVSVN